jgi:hypothetical protein
MVKKEASWVTASGWLFILGIIISIIAGLFPILTGSVPVTAILAIIGFLFWRLDHGATRKQ